MPLKVTGNTGRLALRQSQSKVANALLERIRGDGITLLLIEHDMKLVMGLSHSVAVLDYGEKIAEGTPVEIQNNPRVIAAYLGDDDGLEEASESDQSAGASEAGVKHVCSQIIAS